MSHPPSSFPALQGVPLPPPAPKPYPCPVFGRVPGGPGDGPRPCGDTDPYEWTTMTEYGDRAWVKVCGTCRTWIQKNKEAAQAALEAAGRAGMAHGDDAALAHDDRVPAKMMKVTDLEQIDAYKELVDKYTAKEIAPIAQKIVAEIPVGVLEGPEVDGRRPNNGDVEGATLQEACLIREVERQLLKRTWFPATKRPLGPAEQPPAKRAQND